MPDGLRTRFVERADDLERIEPHFAAWELFGITNAPARSGAENSALSQAPGGRDARLTGGEKSS